MLKVRSGLMLMFLLLFGISLYGQKNGYVKSDTAYVQGKIFAKRAYLSNRMVKFQTLGKVLDLTPSQINEYGFDKGDVYVRRRVLSGSGTSDYFLYRSVLGDRILFELKEKQGVRFFLEYKTTLTEIDKKSSLKQQMQSLLDTCGNSTEIANKVRFNRNSMSRAIRLNNACYTGFFPTARFGGLAGFEHSTIKLKVGPSTFPVSGSSALIGVFIELPTKKSPSWFLNLQAIYQQHNYGGYHVDKKYSQDYQFSFSAISIPVLLKYRSTSLRWRPYGAFGLMPIVYNWQENAWLTATRNGSIVETGQGYLSGTRNFQVSSVFIAGLEHSIWQKRSVSLELRVKKLVEVVRPSQSVALVGSFYF